ncbi:MAG: hypothetical protein QJR13_04290, partial [Bacillota bacterium]|nr:hypothetical protein [Bacillota bacterium]
MRFQPKISARMRLAALAAALFLLAGCAVRPATGAGAASLLVGVLSRPGEAVNGTAWVEGADGGERVGPLPCEYIMEREEGAAPAEQAEEAGPVELSEQKEAGGEEGPAPEERPDVTPEETGAPIGAPAEATAGGEQAPLPQGGKAMLKVAT